VSAAQEAEIEQLRTENERLHAEIKRQHEREITKDTYIHAIDDTNRALLADNARLRAALEPFARNPNAQWLADALGHIEREHLLEAHRAWSGNETCAMAKKLRGDRPDPCPQCGINRNSPFPCDCPRDGGEAKKR
jgi:hypothetical protein